MQKDLASQLDDCYKTGNIIASEPLSTSLLKYKIHASKAANRVAPIAMDVAAGYGYKKGTLERLYRDARAGIVMRPSLKH